MSTNTAPPAEPVLYVIWHREGKGRRWRKAGRVSTHAEAVAMIGGKGDWHIAPLYDQRLDGEQHDSPRRPPTEE